MYNLIEYSKNYRKTAGNLRNYYRDEPNNPPANEKEHQTMFFLVERTPNNDNGNNNVIQDVKIVVPLKYLSNFWRTLAMLLINCKVSLIFTWSKDCVLTDLATAAADTNADPPVVAITAPAGATFKIKDTKLYVPVVTLSADK